MAAKKNNLPDKPVVSRVPLPVSDSALVIDLPDGQKLVIGKMGQGTVIEVATWRGVGRPDSRTSRMMFGMSSAEIDVENPEAAFANSTESSGGLVSQILGYPMMLIRWLFNIQSVPKQKKNKDGSKKLIIQSGERQSGPAKTGTLGSVFAVIKKIVGKYLSFASKFYSVGKVRVTKLPGRESAVKESNTDLANTDLDIEKWLESIKTSTKKKEIIAISSTPTARKKKK